MKKSSMLLLALMGILSGCGSSNSKHDNGSVSQSDNIIIKKNEYKGIQFEVKAGKETQISLSPQNNIIVDAYLIEEAQFTNWIDQTQNGLFSSASIRKIRSIENINERKKTGWMHLPNGTYRLLIENTIYGTSSPKNISSTDTASIIYSISFK